MFVVARAGLVPPLGEEFLHLGFEFQDLFALDAARKEVRFYCALGFVAQVRRGVEVPGVYLRDKAGIQELAQHLVQVVNRLDVDFILDLVRMIAICDSIPIDLNVIGRLSLRRNSICLRQIADFGISQQQQIGRKTSSGVPKSVLYHLCDFAIAHEGVCVLPIWLVVRVVFASVVEHEVLLDEDRQSMLEFAHGEIGGLEEAANREATKFGEDGEDALEKSQR